MANTRRKAVNIYQNLINKFPDALYLSSGIRKKDRIKVLSRISKQRKSNIPFILVSTQVVEAGVDINFSQIFREKAPLDNIIQVMGRLNREREDEYTNLVVFDYDDYDNEHRPYSQLELNESEKILRVVKDSIDLYSMLGQYYQSVSERNQTYKNYSKELDQHISRLGFDKVWDFIKRYILEDERDPVLIPDLADWNKVKVLLMKDRLTKTGYRIFPSITASLPRKVYDLGIEDDFDKDVLAKNILLPKKEYLSQVYDNVLGTDK